MTLLLGALIATPPLAMDIYLASMPTMAGALSATTSEVQLTLSVYMYGWGIAQLFAGPLSDRYGRRPALLASLFVFVGASLFCALSRDVYMLIGGRLVQAVSIASIGVVPRAAVRDLYTGDKAAHILSLMGVVLGIAPVVAPIIGSNLHVWLGWQSNFVAVAIYGAVLWLCVYVALPETLARRDVRATVPRVVVANYRQLLASRAYVGYLLVAAFGYSGLFAFLAGSAFVFVDVMGAGERSFGIMFGSVMLGNIIGAMIGSRVVQMIGIPRLVRLATRLMLVAGLALGVFALLGVRHPLAVIVPMFAFMVTFTMTMPPAIAGALTPFPQIAGSASSLLAFCQFVVASTAALAVGLTLDGTTRPMSLAIAVASVGTFLSVRLVPQRAPVPAS
ncbi:MAG TPA: multidrug effflux MFS transporter [Casimicrobiaceae bacterium]|jgi:DHA1 family bicyclomycin/chloramphenicol resistance-like MFS transporter|nr:multidrug effflux MFS transporter [Casimicrobiaceae bacterium]